MQTEQYKISLPDKTFVRQVFYQHSPYARVFRLDDGSWWVKAMRTERYFNTPTYQQAMYLRQVISNKCRGIRD